jgi:hypothetical protein
MPKLSEKAGILPTGEIIMKIDIEIKNIVKLRNRSPKYSFQKTDKQIRLQKHFDKHDTKRRLDRLHCQWNAKWNPTPPFDPDRIIKKRSVHYLKWFVSNILQTIKCLG